MDLRERVTDAPVITNVDGLICIHVRITLNAF